MSLKGLPKGWEDSKEILYYQGLLCILKVIYSKLISRHHNNPLIGYLERKKMQELIAKKNYWPILQRDVKTYVKGCDVNLNSKIVCHKLYNDL